MNTFQGLNVIRLTIVLLYAAGVLVGCASSNGGDVTIAPPSTPAVLPVVPATTMTVGELLARGGKQLPAADVKSLFTGAVVEGTDGGSNWRERNAGDGDVTGQSFMSGGQPIHYQGTWWVDENGRRCWANSRWSGSGPSCMYYYILGGKYYASESAGTVAGGSLVERKISR